MDPLKLVLNLRTHREADAQVALRAQQKTCVQTDADRDAAHEALQEFRQTASARERSLAGALMGKVVRLREISDFNTQVAHLRQEAQRLTQVLDQATQLHDQATKALHDCEVTHIAASRQQQKFASLVSSETARLARDLEIREEREIDEAGERRRLAGDQAAEGRLADD